MVTAADYAGSKPTWCPGCGNFGILKAVTTGLVELGIEPHQVLMVSGIGQAGKLPHYTRCNIFNSLHGRTLPVAIGAKIANPELTVIAVGGDTVRIANGKVYVNDVRVAAPDLSHGYTRAHGPGEEWFVPENHYFVLGDNRSNSLDSRDFGPVPEENLKGKVWFRWWRSAEEVEEE